MNKFSLTSLRIEPYVFVSIDGEIHKTAISCATGFLYRRNEQIYLITNWHVISGLDVNTHDYLDKKHSAMPTHLKITPSIKLKDEERNGETYTYRRTYEFLPLYNVEENPLWRIHKVPCVDIAIINISKDTISRIVSHSAEQEGLKGTIDILCINDHPFHDNMLIEVADDVFVIGYPFGKGGLEIPILPVWKRASIASEPSLSYYTDGRDCFLIDTTTRSGMSGSPVIAYKTGAFRTTDSDRLSVVPNGFASKLLGVYSGRIDGYSKDDSFVGVIWKEKLINEIIDSNNFDTSDNLLYKKKL